MLILCSLKRLRIILVIIFIFLISGLGIRIINFLDKDDVISVEGSVEDQLLIDVKQIFKTRNQALLSGDTAKLKSLYNTEVRNGIWAYEHELKKVKYLQQWSVKQGVKFSKINSKVILKRVKEQSDKVSVNLLVSNRYQYSYKNSSKENFFQIGTYHSLDLIKQDDRLLIIKEWYSDPFADSLHLDNLKDQELQQVILAGKGEDFSKINQRRIKAIDYADRYCGAASLEKHGFQYNSKYKNYNYAGGDCANFASQILYESGGFKKDYTWSYQKGSGNKAWVNAAAFNNYMVYSNRASRIAYGSYKQVLKASYKLLPGDYIAYEKKGKVVHISVVTGADSKGYRLVNCHNSDRYRAPWDLGWSNHEVKFWLVRVHY